MGCCVFMCMYSMCVCACCTSSADIHASSTSELLADWIVSNLPLPLYPTPTHKHTHHIHIHTRTIQTKCHQHRHARLSRSLDFWSGGSTAGQAVRGAVVLLLSQLSLLSQRSVHSSSSKPQQTRRSSGEKWQLQTHSRSAAS